MAVATPLIWLCSLSAIVCYVLAGWMIGSRLFHQQGPNTKFALPLAGVAILLHLVLLASSIFAEPGQNMSMTNVASLVAWLIALSMTLASFSLPNIILLPVAYGFASLIVLSSWLLPARYIMHIEVQPAILLHISLALMAYGCLMIALLYALQLGYINHRLKHKEVSLLHSSLPPLMMVEQILFKLLTVGTAILTISLLSGFVFLDDMFAKQQAHKTVFSLLAWGVFVTLLFGHHQHGWRGRRVTNGTVVGAVFLTLAYFGSRFVREVILS